MPDIVVVTDEWLSLNELSNISTDTSLKVQNKGRFSVLIQKSTTKPLEDDDSGEVLTTLYHGNSSNTYVTSGDEVWGKVSSPYGNSVRLNVQVWGASAIDVEEYSGEYSEEYN